MFRSASIFKVVILSLAANSVFILYLLFHNVNQKLHNDENQYYDRVNDYYSFYANTPISTTIKIIPIPMFVSASHSRLSLSKGFGIKSNQKSTADLQLAILRYSKYISLITGLSTKIDENLSPSRNSLIIDCPTINSKTTKYPVVDEDEFYTLNVTKTGSYLYALSLTGIIRGLSTFVQLIERDSSSKQNSIPLVNIVDQPRFTWRGLLLDVSRHWMPVPVIERTLNAMELSKLNVLHLHLSDDQGFRVESIQHNLLHDKQDFFTQKDIRHLVEYARQRRIRIVPEFDIPGHTTSWFVGYPELATEPGPYKIETQWGVMKPTMDPTKESTYTFLDSFFKEMSELFPDPYFHIGGDEVEGSQWMQSSSIQLFIFQHQLRNKNGLQAYFNKRIQKLLKNYGKIMIGWEEILDEISENLAVDKDAIIQSWKSRKSLANAMNKGYRSLLSHGYYLDHLSLSTFHYKIDPVPNDEAWLYNKTQFSLILGGEACMWSEYVTENTIDSRIWPRVLAIAERFWSPSSITNQKFLYERLFRMNHLLDKMQTGVTHLSSYKLQLQNLIIDSNKKKELLHPLVILADVCEPYGFDQRSQNGKYSSIISLTTFVDALQCESELIWKLENLPIDDKIFRDIFKKWSINHARLRQLFFNDGDKTQAKQLWGQDLERLSVNLAEAGRIGLRILDYGAKRILHHDRNHTMNSWQLTQWIEHHNQVLNNIENQVNEVRLAAVRPLRRLLNSIQAIV